MMMFEEFIKLVPGAQKMLPLRKFEVYIFQEEPLVCGIVIRGVQGSIKAKAYDHFDVVTYDEVVSRVLRIRSNVESEDQLRIFSYMIEYILAQLSMTDLPKTSSILLSIENWLKFSKSKKKKISKSKQIGLLGELCFLESLMDQLPEMNHLEGWAGPHGAPVDFLFSESFGVEVKSRIQPFKDWISISSTSQLDNAIPEMHLMIHDFVPTDLGFTLWDKVEAVKARIGTFDEQHAFLRALEKVGYQHFLTYSNLLKVRVFKVFSLDARVHDFPMLKKPVDPRVAKVKYDIHISSQEQLKPEITHSKIRSQLELS